MTMGDGKYMRLGKRIVHMHAPVAGNANDGHDFACGVCGHLLCSCSAEAAEPPKHVLPEGWTGTDGGYTYWYGIKAAVQNKGGRGWGVHAPPFSIASSFHATRELAMAAAMASVAPVEEVWDFNATTQTHKRVAPVEQEPALRPGWCIITDGVYGHADPQMSAVYQWGCKWRVVGDGNHPTLEAAMIRAEELAGGS